MKEIKLICDRCKKEISCRDEKVLDFLKSQYPDKDICDDCDLILVLAASSTKRDLINNQPVGTTLKLMLKRYEE